MSDLPPLTEEQAMVKRLKKGDKEAAAQLYSWFGVLLYRQVILPRIPVVDKAEDVLRDTFRILFEQIERFEYIGQRSIFFWLRRISINLVIDAYRKEKRNRDLADRILTQDALDQVVGTGPESAEDYLERSDARMLIEGAFEKINPRYAKALRLRLLEDKTRAECAAHFEIEIGAFDVLFHRACKAFRDNYPP
ncbi:MAG: hypothetical protein CMK59_14945 [Proteobacteria bacterium]|nr:hypothetical protein [Pseudomonadota bacterium]